MRLLSVGLMLTSLYICGCNASRQAARQAVRLTHKLERIRAEHPQIYDSLTTTTVAKLSPLTTSYHYATLPPLQPVNYYDTLTLSLRPRNGDPPQLLRLPFTVRQHLTEDSLQTRIEYDSISEAISLSRSEYSVTPPPAKEKGIRALFDRLNEQKRIFMYGAAAGLFFLLLILLFFRKRR